MLRKLIDVRSGEGKRALLAALALLLVIASYTVVKSVRDALFLSKFGITELSLIAIGLAVLTGFIVAIYLRGTAGLARNWLIGGTNATIAGTLMLIWLGLSSPGLAGVLPWVLYIWSSIFGVFIVMQFWLLANDLFDPREAKRLFGVLGSGAILGGICGGVISRWLAGVIGTSNLLLVASGMLLAEAAIVSVLWPLRRRDEAPRPVRPRSAGRERSGGGLSALKENRVVRLMALALLLSTMATTLLDWQFKGIVKAAYAGRTDEMAAFFGSLYAYLSAASFVIQAFFTAGLLRRFGVAVGLMILPVSVLAGSALILSHAMIPWISRLAAASSAKVAEGGLRFAIDKASMELMWLPVPPAVKEKGKSFVDTVVDRLGTGFTGFAWLGLAALGLGAPEKIHLISIAVLGLVALWILVLLNARREYLRALRDVLSSRRLDAADITLSLESAEVRRTIAPLLASEDPREVHFALYLLEHSAGPLPELSALLAREDPALREETLKLLCRREDRAHREAAVACLASAAHRVREAAIIYLRLSAPIGSDPLIERLAAERSVDGPVLDVIRLGSPAHAMVAANALREALADEDPARRAAVVGLLSGAPPEMAAALLAPALADGSPLVVAAAIEAAGRARAAQLVLELGQLLAVRRFRAAAAAALREIGAPATAAMVSLLQREEAPLAGRRSAARILGASQRAEVVPALLAALDGDRVELRHEALRALNRLNNAGVLRLDEAQCELVDRQLAAELRELYRALLYLGQGSWIDLRGAERPVALLERVLYEQTERQLERVFRLLALRGAPQDIYAAYLGVRSPLKSIRANSVELLDNMLPRAISARLMPLLESASPARFAAVAREHELQPEERAELLGRLLQAPEPLLRAVAARTVADGELAELGATLAAAPPDARPRAEDELAAEELARARRRLAGAAEEEETTMGLTTIEKALKLQKADVLQRASTEDLAYIAQIAVEEELAARTAVYSEGDPPDALFVILSGKVRLHREDTEIAVLGTGEAFGGWALVDESPRVASATATEATSLLRVNRDDFTDLLSDRVHIMQAVFQAMVERLRNLANVANNP